MVFQPTAWSICRGMPLVCLSPGHFVSIWFNLRPGHIRSGYQSKPSEQTYEDIYRCSSFQLYLWVGGSLHMISSSSRKTWGRRMINTNDLVLGQSDDLFIGNIWGN